jgi:hypothetical protein
MCTYEGRCDEREASPTPVHHPPTNPSINASLRPDACTLAGTSAHPRQRHTHRWSSAVLMETQCMPHTPTRAPHLRCIPQTPCPRRAAALQSAHRPARAEQPRGCCRVQPWSPRRHSLQPARCSEREHTHTHIHTSTHRVVSTTGPPADQERESSARKRMNTTTDTHAVGAHPTSDRRRADNHTL